jgi:hypothetical protein
MDAYRGRGRCRSSARRAAAGCTRAARARRRRQHHQQRVPAGRRRRDGGRRLWTLLLLPLPPRNLRPACDDDADAPRLPLRPPYRAPGRVAAPAALQRCKRRQSVQRPEGSGSRLLPSGNLIDRISIIVQRRGQFSALRQRQLQLKGGQLRLRGGSSRKASQRAGLLSSHAKASENTFYSSQRMLLAFHSTSEITACAVRRLQRTGSL